MKKLVLAALLLLSSSVASSATWFDAYGNYVGNVCRSGYLYTVYPAYSYQPVGSTCPVRNNAGYIVAWGLVSDE